MRRKALWLLGGVLGLLALAAAAIFVLNAALHAGRLTPRITAALEQALGRSVGFESIALRLALPLQITLTGARIANPPGASRENLAEVRELGLALALRPLLARRIEIIELRLSGADLRLERDAEGRGNWQLGGTPAEGGGPRVARLRIRDSRIELPESGLGPFVIAEALLQRPEGEEKLTLDARFTLRSEALNLTAELTAFSTPMMALNARLTGTGLRLDAKGPLAREFAAAGWSLALEAELTSAARLAGLLGGEAAWLETGPLSARAALGPGLALTDIALETGALTLAGLPLSRARLAADDLDGGSTLTLAATRHGVAANLTAQLPAIRSLLAATPATGLPARGRITAAGAVLDVTTELRPGGVFGATDLRLAAPNLAALSALFGLDLPALRDVAGRVRLPAPTARPLRLEGLSLRAAGLDASGALALAWTPRTRLDGRLNLARLDLDALSPQGNSPVEAGRVIPNHPLPIESLGTFDAELDLAAEALTLGGIPWQALRTRLQLTSGRLTLDPLTVTPPGGTLAGRLTLDAAAMPPRLAIALQSQGRGVNMAPLLRGLGFGVWLEGPAEIALDLNGRGATTRELAATLGGEFGLAMIEGRMPRAGMLHVGPNLTRALMPGGPPDEGIAIRCLALRLSAEDGLASSQALLLEGPGVRVGGQVALNLRNESIAAELLPDIRLLGFNTRAPVAIGGTLAAPTFGVEPGQALARVLTDTVTNRLWRSTTVEWLRDAGGGGGERDCGAQLRLARLGRDGAVPQAAPNVIPIVPRELQGPVQDVLRGIGGIFGGARR